MQGRQAFGVCSLGDYIYVAGGGSSIGNLDSCERYSITNDEWSHLPKLPLKGFAMNLLTAHKRYIFGFGILSRDSIEG